MWTATIAAISENPTMHLTFEAAVAFTNGEKSFTRQFLGAPEGFLLDGQVGFSTVEGLEALVQRDLDRLNLFDEMVAALKPVVSREIGSGKLAEAVAAAPRG